jgi:hypothetical protein
VDLEGVSKVVKSKAPGQGRAKRVTPGYPALAVTIINLPGPVITYVNWFSYKTADFISWSSIVVTGASKTACTGCAM